MNWSSVTFLSKKLFLQQIHFWELQPHFWLQQEDICIYRWHRVLDVNDFWTFDGSVCGELVVHSCNVVLTFESVDEIPKSDHWNKSYCPEQYSSVVLGRGLFQLLSLSITVSITSFMSFCVTTQKDMILLNGISCMYVCMYVCINSMVKVWYKLLA